MLKKSFDDELSRYYPEGELAGNFDDNAFVWSEIRVRKACQISKTAGFNNAIKDNVYVQSGVRELKDFAEELRKSSIPQGRGWAARIELIAHRIKEGII